MDKLRSVNFDKLDAIEIGAAILGTGGGGNPYIGKLRCREELKKANRLRRTLLPSPFLMNYENGDLLLWHEQTTLGLYMVSNLLIILLGVMAER